jgi:PBP1b-binding outer membrane lipoprotein LpoB
VVQVLGNVTYQKMDTPGTQEILTLRLLSLQDGREIWSRDQKVRLKKYVHQGE